jgi:hypothetical protein
MAAGPAERARVTPGRDVTVLLVSGCPGAACSTAGHAIPGSRSLSGSGTGWSGLGSPAAAALGYRSCARPAVRAELDEIDAAATSAS